MAEGLEFTEDEIGIETERLRLFAEGLLEPGELYEIRPVPWARPGSLWATPDRFVELVPVLMEMNRAGVNPYFSMNPRREKGASKGEGTLPGSLLVADFDSGITLAEVLSRLDAATTAASPRRSSRLRRCTGTRCGGSTRGCRILPRSNATSAASPTCSVRARTCALSSRCSDCPGRSST